MKKIRDKKIEQLKQYNSKCSKFRRLICCTKIKKTQKATEKQLVSAGSSARTNQVASQQNEIKKEKG